LSKSVALANRALLIWMASLLTLKSVIVLMPKC